MTSELDLALKIGTVLVSITGAWWLLKGKVDRVEQAQTDIQRAAIDAQRAALRSHSRLDDHSGRLTKVEAGHAFHERRLDESLAFVRSDIGQLRHDLQKVADSLEGHVKTLGDKLDALVLRQ